MQMNRRKPVTILLLEDRDDCSAEFAEALRGADLKVIAVADLQTAWPLVERIRPRVIVANMDARTRTERLTFCREVRSDARTARIPVLLTTEHTAEEDINLATDPGVLVLTMARGDGAKLTAAVAGVLTAQRAESSTASRRRRRDVKQTKRQ
jgi:DNA-binding response OmpR family regulator